MERINANEVQSMIEAYASVFKTEEQEVISEETQELQENQANRAKQQRLRQQQLANRPEPKPGPVQTFRDRIFARRSASPSAQANTNRFGQNVKVGSPTGPAQNDKLKKPTATGTGTSQAPLTAKDKAYGPNSTLNKDQQAVNREYDRLRKSDPEAAAVYGKKMAAKGAANKDFKLEKPTQAQSNPTAAQKQASVDASIKSVNTPEKMNKQAPAGTALRAQQDKQAAAKAAANAPRPQPRPGARNADRAPGGMASGRPAPKSAANTAVGSAAAAKSAGGYQLPAGARPVTAPGRRPMARPGARNRMEELDIFDTVKGHLISEHELSEDVAIQVMTLLDEETRREIMEYTASMGAGGQAGTTARMTADGKEPAGDRLLRGIKDRVGAFLQNLNPKALKSTTVEPRKPLVSTQKNSYELEGELVDEGSCGSKKKTSKKKRY